MANRTTAVWRTWISSDTTATSSSSNNVWYVWCEGTSNSTTATMTSSATTDNIWYQWNDGYLTSGNRVVHQIKHVSETEEQKQARIQAEQLRMAEAQERARTEQEAKEKAERLLLEHLNPVQLQQLKEMDAFIVQLETRRYRVRRNHRVQELGENNKPIAEYCIVPDWNSHIPNADIMLAKKLMLEHDEASFLRIANRTPMVQ